MNQTGLLIEDPKLREKLPRFELFCGGTVGGKWDSLMPEFRNQGATYFCTAYAGSAIASAFEKRESENKLQFSPRELFYRTGGTLMGNYLTSTAKGMGDFVCRDGYVPVIIPDHWDSEIYNELRKGSEASKEAVEDGTHYRMKSFAEVQTDTQSLLKALATSPLMVSIGIGKNYWDAIAPAQSSYTAYHAVVLTSIDGYGNKTIFDSLAGIPNFNGFHKLAPDYEIMMALAFIDLPDDWKRTQDDKTTSDFSNALKSHYGCKRVLSKEVGAAKLIKTAIAPHVWAEFYFGRYWTVCVNAVAYAGYNTTDLLNHFYNMRKKGKPLFDLNKKRKDN